MRTGLVAANLGKLLFGDTNLASDTLVTLGAICAIVHQRGLDVCEFPQPPVERALHQYLVVRHKRIEREWTMTPQFPYICDLAGSLCYLAQNLFLLRCRPLLLDVTQTCHQ